MTLQEAIENYGELDIELVGLDGNAFSIMGALSGQARRQGWSAEAREALLGEMQAGNYDHLLQTAMRAVGDLP